MIGSTNETLTYGKDIHRMWFTEQYKEFLAALQFLSIVSLPGARQLFDEGVIEARLIVGGAYFPVIGILLAIALGLLTLITTPFLPGLVVAALLIITHIILTGGLHLDGLMDSCDGLFGGKTSEDRLEIMRDSRVGSFGVLGGACILLLKFACFASLTGRQLWLSFLIVMPTARWCMVMALYFFPNARPTGLGSAFRHAITREHMLIAGLISVAVAVLVGRLPGIIVWLVVSSVAFGLGKWITRLLSGLTGDSYGTIAETMEAFGFLLLVLMQSWF